MAAAPEIIEYKGIKIMVFSHVGLKGQAFIDSLNQATQFGLNYPTPLPALADFTNTMATKESIDVLKSPDALKIINRCPKWAIVGLQSIQTIFLNSINILIGRQLRAFNTKEEALEFLIR